MGLVKFSQVHEDPDIELELVNKTNSTNKDLPTPLTPDTNAHLFFLLDGFHSNNHLIIDFIADLLPIKSSNLFGLYFKANIVIIYYIINNIFFNI